MNNQIVRILLAITSIVALSGCALGVAAGAGYVAADEINEGDGEIDVLEDTRGVGNGKN